MSLTKPEVGADSNLWGGHTNGDWDIVDSIFTATSTMMVSMVLKSDSSIADVTTTSKRMMFNLSGIATSTTRILTVQDSDGTLAYTAQIAAATTGLGTVTTGQVAAATVGLMDLTSVQTATNKTLTAPLLTGILAASTGVTTTAGDNSTKLATTAYVATAVGTAPFSKSFTSTGQAITVAGTLTLAHSLGAQPKIVFAKLHNVTSELGYTTGQEITISLGPTETGASNGRGVQVQFDATNLTVIFGGASTPIQILNGSTGFTTSITLANWTIIFSAFA